MIQWMKVMKNWNLRWILWLSQITHKIQKGRLTTQQNEA
jgi:hypothetical protein